MTEPLGADVNVESCDLNSGHEKPRGDLEFPVKELDLAETNSGTGSLDSEMSFSDSSSSDEEETYINELGKKVIANPNSKHGKSDNNTVEKQLAFLKSMQLNKEMK